MMNKKIKFISLNCLLFLLLTFLTENAFSQKKPDSTNELNTIASKQVKASENEINMALNEVDSLVKAKRFEEAALKFKYINNRYQNLGQTGYIKDQLDELRAKENKFYREWANHLKSQAYSAYVNRDWNKSIGLTNEAIKVLEKSPNVPEDMINKEKNILDNTKKKSANHNFNKATSLEKVLPNKIQTQEEISLLFDKAKAQIKTKQYEKARDNLERILVIDPYNFEALYMLENLYKDLVRVGKKRSDAEIREKMAQARWAYSQPISSKIVKEDVHLAKAIVAEKSDNKLRNKLKNLIIDKIDFDEATISSVITYLNRKSKQLDPEGTGINFVLRLDPKTENALAKVSMSMDEIPFEAALKYICLATGLKYKVEEHAVIIGNAIQTFETRFFTVKSDIIRTIVSNVKIEERRKAAFGLAPETEFGEDVNDYKTVTMDDLKKYFGSRGVPFPNGAMIAWDNRTSTLTATNTPQNLKILEKLLDEIDLDVPLVLIETKFVELNETELKELGFDANINWNQILNGASGWAISTLDPNYVVSTSEEKSAKQLINTDDILTRYVPTGGKDAIGKVLKNLTFSLNGSGGEGDVAFNIYALDRSGIAEVLSAPKVITKSGTTATIRAVQEEYFPINWTEPEVSIVSNAVQVNQTVPEFETPSDLGIKLEVTPTVSPNGHTILLELRPSVVDLIGWTDYNYNITEFQVPINTVNTINEVTNFPYNQPVRMPEISLRTVETTVKAFDGSTIVLGGAIKDETVAHDDRVPFLGDIPFIGRLFSNQYEKSQKINLLIFLTARLVNPDGTPVRDDHKDGIFNFREY